MYLAGTIRARQKVTLTQSAVPARYPEQGKDRSGDPRFRPVTECGQDAQSNGAGICRCIPIQKEANVCCIYRLTMRSNLAILYKISHLPQ